MNEELSEQHILIVEDDPDNRSVLQMRLEFEGYSCTGVENGKVALHIIPTHDFDLIITDYHMPLMNGLELLRHMKATPNSELIPVIIISCSVHAFLNNQAMLAGAYAFLQKPYSGEELLLLVKRALKYSSCPCS